MLLLSIFIAVCPASPPTATALSSNVTPSRVTAPHIRVSFTPGKIRRYYYTYVQNNKQYYLYKVVLCPDSVASAHLFLDGCQSAMWLLCASMVCARWVPFAGICFQLPVSSDSSRLMVTFFPRARNSFSTIRHERDFLVVHLISYYTIGITFNLAHFSMFI